MMKLEYSSVADKQLRKLPKTEQKKILRKLLLLALEPLIGKLLKGEFEGLRSLRAWPYRIVYEVRGEEKVLIILSIVHRQSAY